MLLLVLLLVLLIVLLIMLLLLLLLVLLVLLQVSKKDSEILCSSHSGWVAEVRGPGLNYWLKARLLDKYTPDKRSTKTMDADCSFISHFPL